MGAKIALRIIAWIFFRKFGRPKGKSFWRSLYIVIWERPKMQRMEKYIKRWGWTHPSYKNTNVPNYGVWVNPDYPNNGHDDSGEFTLYGAYQRAKGKS